MDYLKHDSDTMELMLRRTLEMSIEFLRGIAARDAGVKQPAFFPPLPGEEHGMGTEKVLALFRERYERWISGSTGPRYFGFIVGGVTPAALAGDWLTSVYDQNALGSDESVAAQIELDALALLRDLFGLPDVFSGAFVSGATMSNFVGLALGRQWLGHQLGVDIAQEGLAPVGSLDVLSATPHSSVYKALSMLGMGRNAVTRIPCLPGREAVDLPSLEEALKGRDGRPCIVVANAGTLNTVDFDDLAAIASLRETYPFWLHVDAAFGGFAACSSDYRHFVKGMDLADSITIDAHKWLNVPYDSAVQFTRHHALRGEVFQNNAAYLGEDVGVGNFVQLTPENSRRLRALPSLFTLLAYGKSGYARIVEENCRLARWLGEQIERSERFILLSPVRMNGICFSLCGKGGRADALETSAYLEKVKESGGVFLTPTTYDSLPALRASVSNWRTTDEDMRVVWRTMERCARE